MIIKNGRIILPTSVINADIRVENDRITDIRSGLFATNGEQIVDANGAYVSAGFVDIHTHGGNGADFMDCTFDALKTALSFHRDNGTTTVLPTSCTAPKEQILKFLQFYKDKINADLGIRIAGVHLEGPYLSKKNKGAQKEEDLQVPSVDDYSYILDNASTIKTLTLSPELDGADRMVKRLKDKGITICGGHDDGIYPDFMPAINNGLTHLTHLYCAMSELRFVDGVRNIGLREYGLIDDNLTAEIIADNKHIPPMLAKLIIKCKGADKVCVVSDSLRCAGLKKDGALYTLGSGENAQKVKIGDGVAVLEDGSRFAGSITSVRQMVKNLIGAGIPLVDAVKMGTLTPSAIIGMDNEIGSLEVGKKADICILDNDFNLIKVFVGGKEYATSQWN